MCGLLTQIEIQLRFSNKFNNILSNDVFEKPKRSKENEKQSPNLVIHLWCIKTMTSSMHQKSKFCWVRKNAHNDMVYNLYGTFIHVVEIKAFLAKWIFEKDLKKT